ncbi:Uncharacterised protein [Klebsiella pneumoniae]|uniref:Uncharacterized protein n=1 Tax=Klebsiella pneumoniae TaxID=573 RepID=A0A377XK76_KLEPN|nr:Uncharacterised protein [Klebsiella pneumoniae]
MTGVGAGAAGAGLTSPLRMICATCCFSIFTALSCPLTVGLSGASACTLPLRQLEIAIPLIGSDGQPQACRIFSGTPRPLKLRLTWRCGKLGYRGGGLQNAALGEGAKLSDIDRRGCGVQFE